MGLRARYSNSARIPLDFSEDSGDALSSGHRLRRMIGSRKHTIVTAGHDVAPSGPADTVPPRGFQVVEDVIPSAWSDTPSDSDDFFALYLAAARSGVM